MHLRAEAVAAACTEGPIPGETAGKANSAQANINSEAEAEVFKFAGKVAPLKVNGDTVWVPGDELPFSAVEQKMVDRNVAVWVRRRVGTSPCGYVGTSPYVAI